MNKKLESVIVMVVSTIIAFIVIIILQTGGNKNSIIFLILGIYILIKIVLKLVRGATKVDYKDMISMENIPTEFENIYQNLHDSCIINLERLRKQARWRVALEYIFLLWIVIGYFIAELEIIFISVKITLIITALTPIIMLIYIGFMIMNRKSTNKYRLEYKEKVIEKFIYLINENLIYKPGVINEHNGVEDGYKKNVSEEYSKANFNNENYNRFYQDDYIEGNLTEDVSVMISDIHTQMVTGSGKNRSVQELFKGIFATTKCNKNINSVIRIYRNKFKISDATDRVQMDSQEFEKYFDVYSANAILTMQVLTSDIMNLLQDFYNKYKLDFELIFKNDTIYLRFFTGAMFEPKIFGNSMDKELLFIYYCILKFIVEVTKATNNVLKEIEI